MSAHLAYIAIQKNAASRSFAMIPSPPPRPNGKAGSTLSTSVAEHYLVILAQKNNIPVASLTPGHTTHTITQYIYSTHA